MHDLAEIYLASKRFGQQERVEREQQLVLLGEFVGEFETIGDELGRPATALGGYSLNSLKAGLQIVRQQAHVECDAPSRILRILRNGWPHRAFVFGKDREQMFEPVLAIGLVLRASPLRINILGGQFGA